MGNFAHYEGHMEIPDHLKERFTKQMIKVLNYGGMMEIESVRIYGLELNLLKPLELSGNEEIRFHYNYFEDDAWETAGYDAKENRLWSDKIGDREFAEVMLAAYALCEVYDKDVNAATINGDYIDPYYYVAWINHLLGEKFTVEKRQHLWELAEARAFCDEDRVSTVSFSDIEDLIPRKKIRNAGGTELTDLCYVAKGTESLETDQVAPGSYPADILECKKRIAEYLSDGEREERVKEICLLLRMKRDERKQVTEKGLDEIAKLSLTLPARVILYLTAGENGEDFWKLWRDVRKEAYHDEVMKAYASEELEKERQAAWKEPVPGMRTSDFLYEDGYYVFSSTPDELKRKPKYYVSDDDRLFWWDGTDEVIPSDEMDLWMKELAGRHAKLMQVESDKNGFGANADDFLKEYLFLLAFLDKTFHRIMPFQGMFYEFLQNGSKKEYRAAIALLRELADENRKEGRAIEHLKGSWGLASRKVTFNPGRINIKRYMSIMANVMLRKKYFGF